MSLLYELHEVNAYVVNYLQIVIRTMVVMMMMITMTLRPMTTIIQVSKKFVYKHSVNAMFLINLNFLVALRVRLRTKQYKLENVAIIAMYCQLSNLRPPDAIAFPT